MASHPKRPFLTIGLPFLVFMVLGHRALTYIGQGRYDIKDEYARQKELLVTQNRVSIPKEAIVIPPQPSDDYDMVPVPKSNEESE